jgi:hypothetical protein
MRMRRVLAVASCAVAVVALSAGSAFAGEITGNGKPLWTSTDPVTGGHTLHGQSACAFSGQEDLQFVDEEGDLLADPHKGDPGHAQSWGQIPKAVRDSFPAEMHPGIACNPTKSVGE